MGGIGAILILLNVIPSVGWIISIAGFILVLVAVHRISQYLNERKIFNDMVISVVTAIAAVALIGVMVVAALLSVLGVGQIGPAFNMPSSVSTGQWIAFGLFVLPGLLGSWILLIISAIFLRRSLEVMGRRLSVSLFDTAGLLYLIGAILAVIIVGFLLVLVAEIILAIAFFSINEEKKVISPAEPA